MKQNVGGADRALRIITGSALIVAAIIYLQGIPGVIAGCFGMGLILTGIFGFCMLYIPLRISTKKPDFRQDGQDKTG
ncbi:MAG: DUF2892 domain-containing protein [Nitrospinae bacterium]|nr:DUF2892 domain-containing protein [Nitrospinota bacterium]MBI3813939.1 DUF2892 domain-containing protein [Nitrospinota bacterium]